jgi:hypothetical protein
MTASLDSEAEVRLTLHLPVSSQKSVNFELAGYSSRQGKRAWIRSVGLVNGPGLWWIRGAAGAGRGHQGHCHALVALPW